MSGFGRFLPPRGWEFGSFKNADGKDIRYGTVEATEPKSGTIVITTGYADFMETYYETIHDFLDRGFSVWVMDWPEHGKAPVADAGKKQKKPHAFQELVRDLHQFRSEIVKPVPGKPVAMSTHSIGGNIGLQYLKQHPKEFDFAVMIAPLIDFEFGDKTKSVARNFFKLMEALGFGDLYIAGGRKNLIKELGNIRHAMSETKSAPVNLQKVLTLFNRRMRAEDPTYNFINRVLESIDQVKDETFLKAIKTPILVGQAGRDDTISNKAIKDVINHLPDARLVMVNESSHNIWTAPPHVRAEWLDVVDGFIEKQMQGFSAKERLKTGFTRAVEKKPRVVKPPKVKPPKP